MIRVVPQPSGSGGRLGSLLALVLLLGGALAFLLWRQSVPGVRADLTPPPRVLGRATPLTLDLAAARGQIAAAEVRIVQAGNTAVAYRVEAPASSLVHAPLTVDGTALGLKEGPATLEVWARDDVWRPLRRDDGPRLSIPVTIDLTPPAIEILAATQYVSQGGAGLVAFRVTGGETAEVRAGSLRYPSFPSGETGARLALVGLPWNFQLGTALLVTARDEAGNTASRSVPSTIRARAFRHDTVTLTDAFLGEKVPELRPQRAPDTPLLDAFLVLNRDQRRQAEEEKRVVAAKTADRALWHGAFIQPRNTKVFSNFAETRRYLYQDAEVDTQVHLGFDLASLKQSPVPAANRGVVVFAGPLTIYGNTVIVDHGLGLQTLYGHQSSLAVKVGDQVENGQTLGHTGSTGLAIGDHLHFEVLVNGVAVTPVEWWDAQWIRDHIAKPLQEAALPPIGAE